MIHARRLLCCAFILLFGGRGALADDKPDFKTHPFFQHLLGEWTAEGELKGPNGADVKVKEEWKTGIQGDNTLVIDGTRELNGNAETFKWTIVRNPGTGLYEATHQPSANSPDTQHFEINIAESGLSAEMTAFLNSSNSKVIIIDSFAGKDRDSFESKVTLTDDSGAATLTGTITHKRVKQP